MHTITDIKGTFSFASKTDSIFHVKASHLGCYIIDTILAQGNKHELTLYPSTYRINEITITNNPVETSIQAGNASG
jgi:hypothetical protein